MYSFPIEQGTIKKRSAFPYFLLTLLHKLTGDSTLLDDLECKGLTGVAMDTFLHDSK
jgi:hypothetical protein